MTVLRLAEKGRGRALRAAWSSSDAPVLPYMDVDLSTDLAGLLPLVAPLISATTPCCGGTLRARFSDAQCGFKAIRADVAAELLPLVEDTDWFFDTELLVLAERTGLRIHEVPVDWIDHPDSRVDIAATALADLHGVARLGRTLATRTTAAGGVACPVRPGATDTTDGRRVKRSPTSRAVQPTLG